MAGKAVGWPTVAGSLTFGRGNPHKLELPELEISKMMQLSQWQFRVLTSGLSHP